MPIYLFSGPPGTGKTSAIQAMAAESGFNAWELQGLQKTMQENPSGMLTVFENVLEHIENLPNSIVFLDEAEVFFPSRGKLAEYNSIEVRSHKAVLNMFLQWSQGLCTKAYHREQPPILCLGTNLREELDDAVLDRVKADITFPLPDRGQCAGWWSLYAHQLCHLEIIALGRLCSFARLSFRDLEKVRDEMVWIRAERSSPCRIQDYARQILDRISVKSPTFWEILRRLPEWSWTAKNFFFLFGVLNLPAVGGQLLRLRGFLLVGGRIPSLTDN